MDICINLLPPEILARHEKKHRQRLLFITGGILLTALVFTFFTLGIATSRMRAEASQLQQQRQALESRVQSMEKFAKPQASLKQLETLVGQAVGTPLDWANLVEQMGANITPGVWLTDLSAGVKAEKDTKAPAIKTGSGNPGETASGGQAPSDKTQPVSSPTAGELVVRGYAYDHPSVALWLDEFSRVTSITDVRCQFSSLENFRGQPMIQFEIKAALLPGPAYKPPLEKAGEDNGGK